MNREDYRGPIHGMVNGIVFPLNMTVEQVQQALEENKKLKDLQEKYNDVYATCADLAFQCKKQEEQIKKAKQILS